MEKQIPLYDIVPGKGELTFVSLVDRPAIMEKGLAFNNQSMQFSADTDKGMIVGPAMIPDVIIPRYDDEMGEYAVRFSKETIEYFFEQFNELTKEHKVNIDHTDTVVKSAFVRANWLVEDKENDKMNYYGLSYPEGTWMMEVKVKDLDWFREHVKKEGRYGFSVEGLFQLEMAGNINKNELKMEKMTIEQFKLMLAELTPEEVSAIQEVIKEVMPDNTPADLVEDVAALVTEVIEDVTAEDDSTEELATEDKEEELATEEKEKDYYSKEEVDSKIEEMITLIAELKNELTPKQDNEEEQKMEMSAIELRMQGMRNLLMSEVRLDF